MRVALFCLGLLAISPASAFEQREPRHTLGNADIRGLLAFEVGLAGFALSEAHSFRLSLRHEQEMLPGGRAISKFVVPQLRAGLKTRRDGSVSFLLPGWSSYRSIKLDANGGGVGDGCAVEMTGASEYKVSTRNGWSYLFDHGVLVSAEAGGQLRIHCDSVGERIAALTLVAYGREKQLCSVDYDKAGLISRLRVGAREFCFARRADGALLSVKRGASGATLLATGYDEALVAWIESEGEPRLDLSWQRSPSFRGDFLRRGRMVLESDGIFEYELRISDGVVCLVKRSEDGVQRLWMNLLTERTRRK